MTEPLKPKEAAPSLDARAPRPRAVRLRRSAVSAVVLGAAALLSGSLAWAFIVKPEMRAEARDRPREGRDPASPGTVRAGEVITDQPASYDRLAPAGDALPEPRLFAQADTASPEPEDQGDLSSAPRTRVPEPSYAPPSASPRPLRPEAFPSSAADAAASSLFFTTAQATASPPPRGERATGMGLRQDYAAVYGGHALLAPLSPYELKAGAFIPAALVTAVDTSRPGPVVAAVTQNVFDTVTGRILLVPQGTKLIGRHGGESRYGDKRAFLIWDRLILPNGKSLVLTEEAGVDAEGTIGVQGRADRRLLQLGAAALFAGAISTLGELARDGDGDGSLLGSAGDAASIEAAQVGGRRSSASWTCGRRSGCAPDLRCGCWSRAT
jgi:type IV secretion system protein VirB10